MASRFNYFGQTAFRTCKKKENRILKIKNNEGPTLALDSWLAMPSSDVCLRIEPFTRLVFHLIH